MTSFILLRAEQTRPDETNDARGEGGSRLKPRDTPPYLDFTRGVILLVGHEMNTITDFDALRESHVL